MVHGEDCQYPVYPLYAKPHDKLMMMDGFAEWLDKQFRDAHSSAGEILGTDQRRQKSYYWKKNHGEPYAVVTKSGYGHKRRLSQRSSLTRGKDHML